MIFLFLFHTMMAWSKEVRSISFVDKDVKVCGQQIPWVNLLPALTPAEADCLDANESLEVHSLMGATESASDAGLRPQIFSIPREKLVKALKKVKGTCLEKVELKIPANLRISLISQLNSDLFQPWLESEIQKNILDKKITLTQVSLPKLDCAPIRRVKWGSFRLESKNGFRFLLMVDDKNFGVSGEFRIFQKIPVAKRNINFMEKLTMSDFEVQEKDVTHSPGYASSLEELAGRTIIKPIPQGAPVELKFLKQEFQVEKGQLIQVQFRGPNFIVSATAVAEQNGIQGELIKLKNTETQKIISGIVLKKGVVEVQ